MSYERKDGVVLFTNERTTEAQPVLMGFVTLKGEEYEVALWGKVSKKGSKYWSGNIKPKGEERTVRETPPLERDEMNDSEIPF